MGLDSHPDSHDSHSPPVDEKIQQGLDMLK